MLREDGLETGLRAERPGAAGPARGGAARSLDLASELRRHERDIIINALERNRWRMARTAKELNLERSHLYKKLKALGIERPPED